MLKRLFPLPALALGLAFSLALPGRAVAEFSGEIISPDHGQTFAEGSEQHHAWKVVGPDRHLALLLDFTNDPFVDRDNPRQYDHFIFNFPQVTLGADGHTFYYRAQEGTVAVAQFKPGLFGIKEIRLLNAQYAVSSPHGALTVSIVSGASSLDPSSDGG